VTSSWSLFIQPFTWLTQPSIKWLPEALFLEIKRLDVESWSHAATSTAVKKEWVYKTTSHITPQRARRSFAFICIDNFFKNKQSEFRRVTIQEAYINTKNYSLLFIRSYECSRALCKEHSATQYEYYKGHICFFLFFHISLSIMSYWLV